MSRYVLADHKTSTHGCRNPSTIHRSIHRTLHQQLGRDPLRQCHQHPWCTYIYHRHFRKKLIHRRWVGGYFWLGRKSHHRLAYQTSGSLLYGINKTKPATIRKKKRHPSTPFSFDTETRLEQAGIHGETMIQNPITISRPQHLQSTIQQPANCLKATTPVIILPTGLNSDTSANSSSDGRLEQPGA